MPQESLLLAAGSSSAPHRCLAVPQIGFKVTAKAAGGEEQPGYWASVRKALPWVWFYLAFYVAFAAALAYWATFAFMGTYKVLSNLLYLSSAGWGVLMCMCYWPPLATLLPRVETEEGWKIVWSSPDSDSSLTGQQGQEGNVEAQPVRPKAGAGCGSGILIGCACCIAAAACRHAFAGGCRFSPYNCAGGSTA